MQYLSEIVAIHMEDRKKTAGKTPVFGGTK